MDQIDDLPTLEHQQSKLLENYDKKGFGTVIRTQKFDNINKGKSKFMDDLFPPNLGSIYKLQTDYAIDMAKKDIFAVKKELHVNIF